MFLLVDSYFKQVVTKKQAAERAAERNLHKQHTLHAFMAAANTSSGATPRENTSNIEGQCHNEHFQILVVFMHVACCLSNVALNPFSRLAAFKTKYRTLRSIGRCQSVFLSVVAVLLPGELQNWKHVSGLQ